MDQVIKTVYCWIINGNMYLTSYDIPQPDWCDSYVTVEVDTSRHHIFKYVDNTVIVEYT